MGGQWEHVCVRAGEPTEKSGKCASRLNFLERLPAGRFPSRREQEDPTGPLCGSGGRFPSTSSNGCCC